jgi:hypothetical protein
VAGGVAVAALVPAATIEIVPASSAFGPRTYEIRVDDAERLDGTVEADQAVTATGTYTDRAAATGTVILYNWTFFPVAVPAGTYVAAGEQAFATLADVVVPRGRLTGAGTILAGDAEVAVEAAAVGPAANVAAHAIDTVVNGDVDLRLGGVPENPERRVDNPAATSGGVDATGPEITQSDVDAAVTALRGELEELVDAELPTGDELVVGRPDPAEPTIAGTEGLAGTRDRTDAALEGSLAWTAYAVERAIVTELAEAELLDDPGAIPAGHDLLTDATVVTVVGARVEEESLVVSVEVSGRTAAAIDPDLVRQRARGLGPDEAEVALADLGVATVDLWPGWVREVPGLAWRIDVRIVGGEPIDARPSVSADGLASPAASP